MFVYNYTGDKRFYNISNGKLTAPKFGWYTLVYLFKLTNSHYFVKYENFVDG